MSNSADMAAQTVGTPITIPVIETGAPGLLQNSIDERIVKVRPMSTPIDQLSRCGGSRPATAMTVEYYMVDTKDTEAEVSEALEQVSVTDDGGYYPIEFSTTNNDIFEPTETLLFPEIEGGAGSTGDAGPLMVYVLARDKSIITGAIVNPVSDNGEYTQPAIPVGTKVVRMGRAASELDVQTPQFGILPKKAYNNCQIFKMQVEQSTLAKIARKEVDWSFSDQEEAAIIDMRLGMEKNFLFGSCGKIYDPNKREDVYLTGGIWQQAPRSHTLPLSDMSEADLVELCAAAFTGNNGSKRKILIAGTELVTALSRVECSKIRYSGQTFTKWGVEFNEICSNFGRLFVVHSEVFDQCGHSKDGFVLDPDYMTKYVHEPFRADTLDLRKSGVRNTDAVVLTEASCLVLRYPNAHIRVLGA